MSADEQTQVLAAVESNGHGPTSVLDKLRAEWAETRVDHNFDIDVPGSHGTLVLRCKPIPSSTVTSLRTRMEKSRAPDREFAFNADVLSRACDCMMERHTDTGELTTLHAPDGEPVTLDVELARSLGFEATDARSVLLSLFGRAPSPDIAVMRAAGEYMQWASAFDEETTDEYVGN